MERLRLGGMTRHPMDGESPLRCWPSGVDAIGVPSTGLSLGGLLASRARFRFTRPSGNTSAASGRQEQHVVGFRCAVSRS